ncbi:MAG: CHAD domain-containing protein [Anaerolineales bacterium]
MAHDTRQFIFPPPDALIIAPTDSMTEAVRKALLGYLQEMLAHEPIARAGDDPEGVHKMRVALRRMRSLYRVVGKYLPESYGKPYPALLKRTARALGSVRDLDVLGERTAEYIRKALDGEAQPLRPLLAMHAGELRVARESMLRWLDDAEYQQFVFDYHSLLSQSLTLEANPRRTVRLELPTVVYKRHRAMRRDGAETHQHDVEELHQLRIQAKRLRYTLDAFADVLGETAEQVVEELKPFQDHLGRVQDAVVAIEHISAALEVASPDERAPLHAYQDACKSELSHLLATYPAAWRAFNRYETRRWLALAISRL